MGKHMAEGAAVGSIVGDRIRALGLTIDLIDDHQAGVRFCKKAVWPSWGSLVR